MKTKIEAAKRAGRPCVEDGGNPIGVVVTQPQAQTQVVPTEEAAAPVVRQEVRQ